MRPYTVFPCLPRLVHQRLQHVGEMPREFVVTDRQAVTVQLRVKEGVSETRYDHVINNKSPISRPLGANTDQYGLATSAT